MADGLLQELNKIGRKTIGYAEEKAFVISGKFGGVYQKVMQIALSYIEDWYNREGLSADKTIFIPFTRKNNLSDIRDILLYQKKLWKIDENHFS